LLEESIDSASGRDAISQSAMEEGAAETYDRLAEMQELQTRNPKETQP
jgi:hypothetical protein